jgi:eukaryotic-like serine/threonine-protein kinase
MKRCPKCQKQFSDDANFCPVDAARLAPLEGQVAAADPIAARFDLGERLGGGRTGAVFRATDKATGHAAAVKIIAPAVVALPALAQRLERELKQLERVHSSGVAKVLASGKRGDDSWVALELLDGAQTLAEAIAARGAIPLEQAAHLIEVIGEALIEAAQVGVVHRDLAPKNVLFAGDEIKLINFSLPVPPAPGNHKIAGVAEFVAPEQHDAKPVDQRSNLYSLGALYYFVLTGGPVQIDASGAVAPLSGVASVPAAVEAVIVRALDRSPSKRFLTVRQFVDEVSRIARGEVGADLQAAPASPANGRGGTPRAELIQTLLGIRGSELGAAIAAATAKSAEPLARPTSVAAPTTAAGIAPPTQPVATRGPEMPAPLPPQAISERSPWAPPAAVPPQSRPAITTPEPVAAALAVGSEIATSSLPSSAARPAAPVVATPVVPPPVLAAPILGATTAKKPSKPGAGGEIDAKGKFRETMWFKKGELDAQAAQDAAAERATTGKDSSTDKADSLPIDERYKDDGSLSRSDKEKYSLRTGATMMTAAVREPAGGGTKVSEDALIGEMKGGRTKVLVVIAIGVIALIAVIAMLVR